jgi:integrase
MVRGMVGRPTYPGGMRGSGGTPPGRVRPRGNIETLASGSLRVRVYAGVDVLTGRELYLKETVPAGPDAEQRAQQALDELLRQVREGRAPRTNASVRQLVERHIAVADLSPRGPVTLGGYLSRHIGPLIGDLPIGSVNAEVLDDFYAKLRRCRDHCDGRSRVLHAVDGDHTCDGRCRPHTCKPLAPETVRKIHYLLNAAYKNAIRWKWIAVNPMDQAVKPAAPRPDPQPPTPVEAAALLAECWRHGFGPVVWVAMTTGARRGELCALRWRHLQARHTATGDHDCLTAGCTWDLVIRRAIGQGDDGSIWETDTKGHQRRHVALDPETVTVLLEHRQECARLAQQVGATLTEDCFIFTSTPDGTQPIRPSTLSQRYERSAAKLGIQTRLHRLRHYSATELITAGVDIRTVAGRLGHRDAATTLRIYAAWVSAADQRASTALMQRMPQRPPTLTETDRAKLDPRWPHEQVAATLHTAWRAGLLAPGAELTVKEIAHQHQVSVGTAHRVITLLSQWNVLRVCPGQRSLVLPLPAVSRTTESNGNETTRPVAETAESKTRTQPLTLELLHLGRTIRILRTAADPHDFDALLRLMRDAVHRIGADPARIGEYEMAVRLADASEPLATVVTAA